jgi:hypothetical protein
MEGLMAEKAIVEFAGYIRKRWLGVDDDLESLSVEQQTPWIKLAVEFANVLASALNKQNGKAAA